MRGGAFHGILCHRFSYSDPVRPPGLRRLDWADADRGRLDRHGAVYRPPRGRQHGHDHLGVLFVVDADRSAAVYLDGGNPFPHAAFRGHVQGALALAGQTAGATASRKHHRLHDLRGGIRLIGRNLCDDRQDDAAGTQKARLSRLDFDRHAGGRRYAGFIDSAVDYHDRIWRHGECVDCQTVHCRDFAGGRAGRPVYGVHDALGAVQPG